MRGGGACFELLDCCFNRFAMLKMQGRMAGGVGSDGMSDLGGDNGRVGGWELTDPKGFNL